MLIVNGYALRAIDILHFVYEILAHRLQALQSEYELRVLGPGGEWLSGGYAVAGVHDDVRGYRYRILAPLFVFPSDCEHSAVFGEAHFAGHARHDVVGRKRGFGGRGVGFVGGLGRFRQRRQRIADFHHIADVDL